MRKSACRTSLTENLPFGSLRDLRKDHELTPNHQALFVFGCFWWTSKTAQLLSQSYILCSKIFWSGRFQQHDFSRTRVLSCQLLRYETLRSQKRLAETRRLVELSKTLGLWNTFQNNLRILLTPHPNNASNFLWSKKKLTLPQICYRHFRSILRSYGIRLDECDLAPPAPTSTKRLSILPCPQPSMLKSG